MRNIPGAIVERLHAISRTQPQAIALFAPEMHPLTYSRLMKHIVETAGLLQDAGVERESRIGLVGFSGPDYATAFLSIISTATCAPLNPHLSESEFAFCFSDLRIDLLIVQSGSLFAPIHVARRNGIPVLVMAPGQAFEAGIFKLTGEGAGKLDAARRVPKPDDLAIVMHTSGTTSQPKTVPLTQQNVCSSADSIAAVLELSASDCCLNVMPLFHIHGLVAALLAPLFAGGSVVCSPGFSSEKFLHWLRIFPVSWYTAVPAMHKEVLREASLNPVLATQANLRFIRSATSPLDPELMSDLERVFGVPVIQSYGMTEASPQITSNPLPPKCRKPGSVGPAAGPEVAIMNNDGKIQVAGRSGEVVIRGANIMKGYEKQTLTNRDAFFDGWFRTGDEGYLDQEGYLFITGRIKEVINRGGKKVAPGEIDEVLMKHPDIVEAAAFSLPHSTLGEDLAAAVVLENGATVHEQEIRRFAFEKLADHKVPTQILIVDSIPRSPTGKLQRMNLAQYFAGWLNQTLIEPRNSLEAIIVEIFQEVLEAGAIGINDNFFSLGGDSLRGVTCVARIHSRLGIELSPVSIFHNPTATEIAGVLESMISAEPGESLGSIQLELENLSDDQAQHFLQSAWIEH